MRENDVFLCAGSGRGPTWRHSVPEMVTPKSQNIVDLTASIHQRDTPMKCR